MDSSSSGVNNNSNNSAPTHLHPAASSTNIASASPLVYSSPIGVVGGGALVMHSPIIGDYTDELVGNAIQSQSGVGSGEQPRAKKVSLSFQINFAELVNSITSL